MVVGLQFLARSGNRQKENAAFARMSHNGFLANAAQILMALSNASLICRGVIDMSSGTKTIATVFGADFFNDVMVVSRLIWTCRLYFLGFPLVN